VADDGEAALEREVEEAAADEQERSDRLWARWRRFRQQWAGLVDGEE
jgi:hypothetical protein